MTKAFGRKMKRRLGAVIDIIPVVWDTRKGPLNLFDPVIDPSSAQVTGTFVSILEREKFWKRFRGTLGKNVNWEAPVPTPTGE